MMNRLRKLSLDKKMAFLIILYYPEKVPYAQKRKLL